MWYTERMKCIFEHQFFSQWKTIVSSHFKVPEVINSF